MDKEKLQQAARQWIDDWNQRNLEDVMAHYADDIEFYSPTVVRRWNIAEGKLAGKAMVEQHFRKGIEEVPGIQFEFHSILYGVESVILFYKRETGKLAADLVVFNDAGKVREVRSYYE
jgi:ketosteroid isomerase-like protein